MTWFLTGVVTAKEGVAFYPTFPLRVFSQRVSIYHLHRLRCMQTLVCLFTYHLCFTQICSLQLKQIIPTDPSNRPFSTYVLVELHHLRREVGCAGLRNCRCFRNFRMDTQQPLDHQEGLICWHRVEPDTADHVQNEVDRRTNLSVA